MKIEGRSYIVFQLNLPSYFILRRYGNFVKSTVSISGFRSGKNSSNGGALVDIVENNRPVFVIWDLTSRP
jgi:hypothetical protein